MPWLLLLAALGACLWLLFLGDVLRAPGASDRAADEGRDGVGLRGVSGRTRNPSSTEGPALRAEGEARSRGVPRGAVTVRVLGPGDLAVPYAVVAAEPGPGATGAPVCATTGADGRAVFADLPRDGSWRVRAHVGWPPSAGTPPQDDHEELSFGLGTDLVGSTFSTAPGRVAGAPVGEAGIVLRVRSAARVRVTVVEADTGRERSDARLRWPGDRLRAKDTWVGAPATFVLAWDGTEPWSRQLARLAVDVPEGFVAWDPRAMQGEPCTRATEVRYVLPLRRSVGGTLAPTLADGSALPARVVFGRVGGVLFEPAQQVDGGGRIVLRGLPFHAGEPVEFGLESEDGAWSRKVEGRFPRTLGPLPPVTVLMDAEDATGGDVLTGLRRELRGDFVQSGVFFGPDWIELVGMRADPAAGAPTLRVRVLREDGSPAAGVWVEARRLAKRVEEPVLARGWYMGPAARTAWADARGIARLSGLEPGAHRLVAYQAGFVDAFLEADAPAEGEREVTIVEGGSGTLELIVVDEEGRGLPHARCELVAASLRAYVDLHEDVQRLDVFTDDRGRRTYRRVPTGPTALKVAWGSRTKDVDVVVRAGERRSVRVVLPSDQAQSRGTSSAPK